MDQVLLWLNANSGAVMALAALGGTMAAVVLVGITSKKILQVNQELLRTSLKSLVQDELFRQASAEPEVVPYLLPDESGRTSINFIVQNVGQGPAFDIKMTFRCDVEDFRSRGVIFDVLGDRRSLNALPQGVRFVAPFGSSKELLDGDGLKPFVVTVEYTNSQGKQIFKSHILDVRAFSGVSLTHSAEYETANALNRIAETMRGWQKNTRLQVETISVQERERRRRSQRAEENQKAKDNKENKLLTLPRHGPGRGPGLG